MSISVYTGSELNRLARKFIENLNRELKPKAQKASFADWQLVIGDNQKRLEIRYALYQMHLEGGQLTRYVMGVRQPLNKIGTEFGTITL